MKPVVAAAAAADDHRQDEAPTRVGVPARAARVHASVTRVRARVEGGIATVRADLAGAWWWDAHPRTVREVWSARLPDLDDVPDESQLVRWAWAVYNVTVALPMTVVGAGITWVGRRLTRIRLAVPFAIVGDGIAWVGQHPARLGLAVPIAGHTATMWII